MTTRPRRNPEIERRTLALLERLADATPAEAAAALTEETEEVRARALAIAARADRSGAVFPTGGWAPEAEDDPPPQRAGAFELAERIGRGGMGDVWLARRADGLYDQTVAVKIMRKRALARGGAAFDDERRFLARLEHPNIARLIDGGVTEDGRPWLAMEYVAGAPLDEAAAALSADTRIALFVAAAEAVQYAHSRLVAHADVKPSNILVSENGAVKVLDFGVAGLIGEAQGGDRPYTHEFASPERITGAGPSVADDVFALGKTLTHLLGDTDDRDLKAIAAKASAVDEADRYRSAADLIDDLKRWREKRPVKARKGGWFYRANRFVQRHPRALAASLASLAALALAASIATTNASSAEKMRVAAETRFEETRSLARFMLFDLYDELAKRPGTLESRGWIAEEASAYLDRLRETAPKRDDLILETARGYRRLAAIEGLSGVPNLGRPEEAAKALDRAEAMLGELVSSNVVSAEALAELGWTYADRWTLAADNAQSREINAKAAYYFARARAADPSNASARLGFLMTEKSRGYDLLWGADKPDEAADVLRVALEGMRVSEWPATLKDNADALEVNILNRLGDALYQIDDIDGALAAYREAGAIVDNMLAGGDGPQWLIVKGETAFNIGGTLESVENGADEGLAIVKDGEAALIRLLDLAPDAAAEKKLLVLYGEEAVLLDALGHREEALAPSAQSVALREKRLAGSPDDPQRMRDLAIGLAPHAELLGAAGRAADACAAARKAHDLWTEIEAAGRLGALDRRRNAPNAEALEKKYCE
ncbi:MAG: serine/threonine-protein kinase [Parvularculaceae bacterium]